MRGTVNGYDAQGGLQFSRAVRTRTEVLTATEAALSTPHVRRISIELISD